MRAAVYSYVAYIIEEPRLRRNGSLNFSSSASVTVAARTSPAPPIVYLSLLEKIPPLGIKYNRPRNQLRSHEDAPRSVQRSRPRFPIVTTGHYIPLTAPELGSAVLRETLGIILPDGLSDF